MRLSLYAQVAAILLAGLLVSLAVSVWLQLGERDELLRRANSQSFSTQIVSAVQLLEVTPTALRADALTQLARGGLLAELVPANAVHANAPKGMLPSFLAQRLGSPRDVRSSGLGTGMRAVAQTVRSLDLRLQDGAWVRLTEQSPTASVSGLSVALWLQLATVLVLVAGVSLLAVRQATQPLKRLSAAADALGNDLDAPPLAETGSPEMRQAARSFNQMQSRINKLVAERERALAAVSHDLRTPLTRLRLRCELFNDEDLREQMVSDIAAMAALIDTTLNYLRERHNQEPLRETDINALRESLVDDARTQGRIISVQGAAMNSWPVRLISLRRALQNLIDNAFKYAGDATLVVDDSAATLRLGVRDHGRGIATAELDRVMQPYYRVDKARSDPGQGIGLGLAIVNEVARAHGGQLELHNDPQGGLSAMLVLPRSGLTKQLATGSPDAKGMDAKPGSA